MSKIWQKSKSLYVHETSIDSRIESANKIWLSLVYDINFKLYI